MKPWNAATEGNEHAHQDMKKFFRHLASHGGKKTAGNRSDCAQVLRLLTVRSVLFREHAATSLPHSKYVAQRCDVLLETAPKRNRKGRTGGGQPCPPKGSKLQLGCGCGGPSTKHIKFKASAACVASVLHVGNATSSGSA